MVLIYISFIMKMTDHFFYILKSQGYVSCYSFFTSFTSTLKSNHQLTSKASTSTWLSLSKQQVTVYLLSKYYILESIVQSTMEQKKCILVIINLCGDNLIISAAFIADNTLKVQTTPSPISTTGSDEIICNLNPKHTTLGDGDSKMNKTEF